MKLLEKIKSCCKRTKKKGQTNPPKPTVEATGEKPPEVPKKGESAQQCIHTDVYTDVIARKLGQLLD